MKDYSITGKNSNRDNMDIVLWMQRESDVMVRKGEAFEFEIPKGVKDIPERRNTRFM